MNTFFWTLSPEKRAELQQYYYDTWGKNLDVPNDPYTQPGNIVAPDDIELAEIAIIKEMSKPPQRRVT